MHGLHFQEQWIRSFYLSSIIRQRDQENICRSFYCHHKEASTILPLFINGGDYQILLSRRRSSKFSNRKPTALISSHQDVLLYLQAVQILFGVMNFSFGIILLFTLEDPYPRFPFIFISGYPFWSSILVSINQSNSIWSHANRDIKEFLVMKWATLSCMIWFEKLK